ncbi:hypothetical protein SAMN04487958_11713 [Vreelandella subterranea]|uniref:Chain length determinant protein n=2 Tax=Vreelandella subterranea TaxID=416874 RepID=A0A1H9WLR9_9GAMM|nr:hypothetical protein SAMN04487958_11713 [Halomonas subterranea]
MEQPPRSTYNDDEISLVELAKVLIHRRWWFLGTFVIVVLASVAWVLLQNTEKQSGTDTFNYTTQLAVGYKTPSHLIEPLPSIIEQLQGAIIPNVKQKNDEFSSLSAKVSYIEESNIVTITSESEQKNGIAEFHEALTTPIVERHERLQRSLENEGNIIFQGDQSLQLIPSEVVALAVKTQQATDAPQGTNSKLILVLGIILGVMLGIVMAFLAEFCARVKESLNKEKFS